MKMNSQENKRLITVTVENEIYLEFKKICEQQDIYMTTLLRKMVVREIETNKVKSD